MKKVAKNLVIAVVIFVLVVGLGVAGWYWSGSWRMVKIEQYVSSSEEYIKINNGQALWELEKAYLIGMNYDEYRIKRAIALLRLNDEKARSETEILLKNKWVNDELYFWYGKYLLDRKEYDLAEKNILMIGGGLPSEERLEYYGLMAYWAGRHADWDKSREYVQMTLDTDSDLVKRMKIGLALMEDDQTVLAQAQVKQHISDKIDGLKEMNGDLYVLQMAEIMNDLHLTQWARALMDGYSWESVENKDIFMVYGWSYYLDGECSMAVSYFEKAQRMDVIDENIKRIVQQARLCADR